MWIHLLKRFSSNFDFFFRIEERIRTERGEENTFHSSLIIIIIIWCNIMNQNQQHLLCMHSIRSKKCLLCLFLETFLLSNLKTTLTLDLDANMVVQYSMFDVCIEILCRRIMLLNFEWRKMMIWMSKIRLQRFFFVFSFFWHAKLNKFQWLGHLNWVECLRFRI